MFKVFKTYGQCKKINKKKKKWNQSLENSRITLNQLLLVKINAEHICLIWQKKKKKERKILFFKKTVIG